MVHDVLGPTGRFLVELGLIGFLLGTCVAYFIMIGDLAPVILADLFDIKLNNEIRIFTTIFLSIAVALPLSLLKKVDSLTSLSILSLILYSSLIMKLMFETTDKLKLTEFAVDKEIEKISYWNMSGLLRTFPIFSMAMSCQTSLFEIFDSATINNDLETIRRDNNIIKKAIYMCSFVYITVGLLGYMAFHEQTLHGNILIAFSPSFTTTLTKLGFVVSLLLSFPLCLFPCRTSVFSLAMSKRRNPPPVSPHPLAMAAKDVQRDHAPMNIDGERSSIDCDKLNEKVGNRFRSSDWLENNQAGHSFGKFYSNLVLPITEKTNKIVSSNMFRLQTVSTTNGNTYCYSKLLDYEDEDEGCSQESERQNTSEVIGQTSYSSQLAQNPGKLHMSDVHFRVLTIALIAATVTLSLLFPHIEFILGIIGSTAGTTVCFVLPAFTFLKIGEHSKIELYLARLLLFIGLAILIFCTYSTIHNANLSTTIEDVSSQNKVP